MSKLCIIVLDNYLDRKSFSQDIESILTTYKLGVFYNTIYTEPFLQEFQNNSKLICSISDNIFYDNCEMLLLPDGCFFNGEYNPVPFSERMQAIKNILKVALAHSQKVDCFLGDSCTVEDDFERHNIRIHDFLCLAERLNSTNAVDLHIVVTL